VCDVTGEVFLLDLSCAPTLEALPDWQKILRTESFTILPSFDKSDLFYAIATTTRLSSKQDGTPEFYLEFVTDQNDPVPNTSLYAMLRMQVVQSGDLGAAFQWLTGQVAKSRLLPVGFGSGNVFHFEYGGKTESAPFAWNGIAARIDARISVLAGRIVYGMLANGGGAVVNAALECRPISMLPRLPISVRFDPKQALAFFEREVSGPGQTLPWQALIKNLDNPPPETFTVTNSTGRDAGQLGLALAGRCLMEYGGPAPCPRISDGPHIKLDRFPINASGPIEWDLRTPTVCLTPVFLNYDPFTPLQGRKLDALTGFTRVPPLPDQLLTRMIVVLGNLPENILDCSSIRVALRVSKQFSASKLPAVQYVELFPSASPSTPVSLQFAKVEPPHPFDFKLTVERSGGVVETDWQEGDDFLLIEAASLPGRCFSVTASMELMAEAKISVDVLDQSKQVLESVSLPEVAPIITFLFEPTKQPATLRVTASDRTGSAGPSTVEVPAMFTALEQSLFSGYGPQTVQVELKFLDGAEQVRIEFSPESSAAGPIVLEFSLGTANSLFSYFSQSLFRNGYRFRVLQLNHVSRSDNWSSYQKPELTLTLAIFPDHSSQENS
jgi:hypothetical protein